jgi:LDH2 family malate/lactate/ureidoglycolate dehydrogenase
LVILFMYLPPYECQELVLKKLEKYGVAQKDALQVARVLIEAEQRGDPSHGLSCMKKICPALESGHLDPRKSTSLLADSGAMAILDAKHVLGPAAMFQAVELGMQKAAEFGLGQISLRHSHHLLVLGPYVRYLAEKGFIGLIGTSTQAAITAPGGKSKLFGTNPLAFGAPSSTHPLVIDMSSTIVARGRIKQAQRGGKKIPLSWALDPDGNPTEDPDLALQGSLQPLGGYKGFALALLIDVLASVLSGSAYSKHIYGTSMHANAEAKDIRYKGDFLLVIDISKFMPLQQFKLRIDDIYTFIRESDEGYIPGETVIKNKENDIEVTEEVYQMLMEDKP